MKANQKAIPKKLKTQPSTKAESPAEETRSQVFAKIFLHPAYRSAAVITKFDGEETVDFWDLTLAIKKQSIALQENGMEKAVEMLSAQAMALDCLFSSLARRSCSNMEKGYGDATERYMKLALRAQAQCAKTIQTMGELKNPRHIAFVNQANIAQNQQVSNGQAACAKSFAIQPNKLIDGDANDLQMDIRTTPAESGADQAVETVGAINRSDNSRRQS